jgi:DNA-binding beta-propeller fold protein YncE
VIFNNSLISGNFPVPLDSVAAAASSLAYDNRSGEIYVASFGDSIEVISETTNEVVDLFEPFDTTEYLTSIVYDYKDNEIFTQYTGSPGTVAVTSTVTNTLVTTITVGDVSEYNTNGLAYDSGLGEVFASNGLSSNVSVISTTTNRLVASVDLPGQTPYALTFDAGTHQVFAANDDSGFYYGNVSVISDATNTAVKSIDVGIYPDAFAYDSGKGEVFVANFNSANVSVINDTTDTVLHAIGVSAAPKAAAYDPAENEVFVTCGNSNESVISDVLNSTIATIPLELATNGAAYDSDTGEVWVLNGLVTYASAISDTSNTVVTNVLLTFTSRYWAYDSAHQEEFLADQASNEVAVVSDTTDHVVAMVQFPGEDPEPYRVAYDSGKGEVFTSDSAGGVGLSVINDTTNTVVRTIPLPGVEPTGMAYDPAKGEIFVGNEAGSNVTVINDTTDAIARVIPNVGEVPWSLVYDSGKGEIFVANLFAPDGGSNVTVINDTTDNIVAGVNIGNSPNGDIVYDSGKGEIFVPNFGSYNVSVISDATNTVVATIYTGTFAWGAAYDPSADEIFVGNFNGDFENITVISDVTDTTVDSIFPDGESASSVAFDPVTGDLYSGDSIDGTVAVITPLSGSSSTHYPVTFTETGLPSGTSWSVTFNSTQNSSTTDSIGYSVLDGSYSYTVGTVTGYTPAPASGPVTVNGGPESIPILFTATPPGDYSVTFTETGLPTGTSWSVTFNATPSASTTSSIGYTVPDGSYSFTVGTVTGYTPTPASGPVTVNGGPQAIPIVFTATPPGTYLVRFTETGLPAGTSWTVTLESTPGSSTTDTILFAEGNNTYSFTVGTVSGYTAAPSSGSVVVDGGPVSKTITFTAVTTPPPSSSSSGFLGLPGSDGYVLLGLLVAALVVLLLLLAARRHKLPIVFTEVGLPPGTRWSVALDGTEESAEVDVIMFTVHNGTHSYLVGSPLGFVPSPVTSKVELKGERIDVKVTFAPPGPKT